MLFCIKLGIAKKYDADNEYGIRLYHIVKGNPNNRIHYACSDSVVDCTSALIHNQGVTGSNSTPVCF